MRCCPAIPRVLPNPRLRQDFGRTGSPKPRHERGFCGAGLLVVVRRSSTSTTSSQTDLAAPIERGRHQRPGDAGRGTADERGEHRRRRCQVDGASDDRGLDDVVLELLVRPRKMHSAITPFIGLALKASKHEERSTEKAADLRDEVGDGRPDAASGASGIPRIRPEVRITVPLRSATVIEPAK